jgi:diaminopimelate decarboxylase
MNEYFHYQQDRLFVENVPLNDIAQRFGTPCYVYSRAALTDGFHQFAEAFKGREHLICYAVKANSNLAILNVFARLAPVSTSFPVANCSACWRRAVRQTRLCSPA